MKVAILDGSKKNNATLLTIKKNIDEKLKKNNQVGITFTLKDIEIVPCTGCFNCWLKTPGLCVTKDAANDILRTIIESDLMIFLTPIIFGGYSSELKKVVDRMPPLASPFLAKEWGKHNMFRGTKKYFVLSLLASLNWKTWRAKGFSRILWLVTQ